MNRVIFTILIVAMQCVLVACPSSFKPSADSETHFLSYCGDCDETCNGGLECIEQICTEICVTDADCSEFGESAKCRKQTEDCEGLQCEKMCDQPCDSDSSCRSLGDAYICRSGFCRQDDNPIKAQPDLQEEFSTIADGSTRPITSDVQTGSYSCRDDSECDDGLFCNGTEICIFDDENSRDASLEGTCFSPLIGPCATPEQCNEEYERCDCDFDLDGENSIECGGTDCDEDHDGSAHVACGGDDCDDNDGNRFPGNTEVCDEVGHDEDCDPSTFGIEDTDNDSFVDAKCVNIVNDTRYGGDDCNDARSNVYPDAKEACDELDNDCDGLTDEDENGNEYGLRREFYRDSDGDEWCDASRPPVVSCFRPDGYSECDPEDISDCDDQDDERTPDSYEICDGKDNDCDGQTDEEPLVDQPNFTDTVVLCVDGMWEFP